MSKKSITTEEFLRAFQGTNPFSKNRVSGAGDFEGDVPTIHGKEFKQLVQRVQRVGAGDGSSGLLILGGAGVGKSHLLARLARWAESKGSATVLFLHNIVASPERMARYLLRASVSVLTGLRAEGYARSELHRLLRRAIRARLPRRTKTATRAPSIELAAKALDAVIREIDDRGDIARAMVAFYRFGREGGEEAARGRAQAAVQWLSGDSIARDVSESLGLADIEAEGAALADDAAVELVFRVLAHLGATASYPLVLCVDQVDNLDDAKVAAMSQFLQVLLDHASQMLVVVSGVKQSMLRFREEGIIAEAAWDRMAQNRLELARIDEADARALIKARLEHFMEPFGELPKLNVKRRADELFPLDEAWLKDQLSLQAEFRSRDVITWADDRWEQQQERLEASDGNEWMKSWPGARVEPNRKAHGSLQEAIDAAVGMKLVERINERVLQPSALPPDADNMATLTLSLLELCRGRDEYSIVDVKRSVRGKRFPACDLLVTEHRPDHSKVTTGVLFVSTDNATKATKALQRLLDDPSPSDHRVLVTDEERRPLLSGAKGKQHLAALKNLRKGAFVHCAMQFEGHAVLDALYGLIASARVGDLEVEYPRGRPRRIMEVEAIESLHRQGKFAEQVLLRELLTEDGQVSGGDEKGGIIDDERARQTIAAHLAWRLCLTSQQVTKELIELDHLQPTSFEDIHGEIKRVAQGMHSQGFLHATAVNDGLYLQLLHKGQSY